MRHVAFRPCLAIVLGLLLVLTSQSVAVARAAPGPAGQVTLCTGSGPVMVHVDENGEPVGPPHLCPDGALLLLNAVAAPDLVVKWIGREIRLQRHMDGAARGGNDVPPERARDPPGTV